MITHHRTPFNSAPTGRLIASILLAEALIVPRSFGVLVFCCGDDHDRPPCLECPCPPGNGPNWPPHHGPGCCGGNGGGPQGMPQWWISEPRLNVRIEDEPLGYQPALGKRVAFTLSYRQRGAIDFPSAVFSVGTNWSCSFRACLQSLGASSVRVHRGGSGWLDYTTGSPQFYDGSVANTVTGGYQVEYIDGSKDIFTNAWTDPGSSAQYYFLTSQQDPAGNTTVYNYATNSDFVKLLSLRDADGNTNLVFYDDSTFTNQITRVADPYNRTNTLHYTASGLIGSIIDVAGISNSFTWDTSNDRFWVTNMTTPYGPTSFRIGGQDADSPDFNTTNNMVNRFVEITLPNNGKELYLFRRDCSSLLSHTYTPVPSTSPLTNSLDNVDQDQRNSFHWGPLQYSNLSTNYLSSGDVGNLTDRDYRLARLRHWLAYAGSPMPSDALSLERAPSPDGSTNGLLTWFDFTQKSGGNNFLGPVSVPSFVALVLPDAATRFTHFAYGNHNEVIEKIQTYTVPDGSAALRTNTFIYAGNDVDLLQAIGPHGQQIVSNYFNSAPHLPDASYDALNQETTYTYNANFQPVIVHLPTGLTTSNNYFTTGPDAGRLQSTTDLEIKRTNTWTYSNGLVASHTDARSLTTSNFWDSLQRLVALKFPDGSTISNFFTNLDLVVTKDRLNQSNCFGYNAIRQKIAETNANGTVTRFGYCSCGALTAVTNAWNTSV